MIRLAIQSRLVPGSSLREKRDNALRYGFEGIELSHSPMIEAAEEALRDDVPVTAIWAPRLVHRSGSGSDPGVPGGRQAAVGVGRRARRPAHRRTDLQAYQQTPTAGTGRTPQEDEALWLQGLHEVARHAERVGGLATGADPVHVVDRLPVRLAIAGSLGLETVDAAAGDVAATLKRRHGPEGIPAMWECTGSTRALHEAVRVARRRGTVVAVGFYQGEATGLLLGEEFHHNGIRIVCGQIGNLHPDETWQTLRKRTIEMALGQQLHLGTLPRLTVPVEDAAHGFAALKHPATVLQVALSY